jgi:hypothetical protein
MMSSTMLPRLILPKAKGVTTAKTTRENRRPVLRLLNS